MYAVVETGGKQVRVREGDVVTVERLEGVTGDEVTFERVLCVAGPGTLIPGNPTVPGARVVGRLEAQGRGRKIVVFKYKSKINYRRKTGHRQAFTRVRITAIHYARPGEGAEAESAPAGESRSAGAAEPLT